VTIYDPYLIIIDSQSASYLSTTTDDDEISVFVQDIDARTPLRGHRRGSSLPAPLGRPLSALGITTTTTTLSEAGQGHDRDVTFRLPGPGLGRTGSTGSQAQSRVPSSLGPARPSRISEVTETSTASGVQSTASVDTSAEADSVATAAVAPMLTRPSDVDAKLREMNEAFMATLAGFGGVGGTSSARLTPRGESPSLSGARTPATPGSGSGGAGSSARLPRDASGGTSSIGSQEVLGKLDLSGQPGPS
jgi:autophagy-related protein 13